MIRDKMINLFNSKKAQKVSMVLLGVMVLIFMIQMYGKAYRGNGYDFTSYLLSAERMLHGQNPYQTNAPFPYIYPMFLAFALIPFSMLPYWLSNFLWYLLNIFSLFYAIYVIVGLASEHLKTRWGKHLYIPLAVLFISLLNVVQNNLLNGQVNFLVLLTCVLFLKYFLANRIILSSIFLALAIQIKLFPLIFLLFVLFRRNYRVLVFSFAFTVVFCLFPYIFLGDQVFGIYKEYVNSIWGEFWSSTLPGHGSMFFTMNGFISYLFPRSTDLILSKVVAILTLLVPIISLEIFDIKKQIHNGEVLIFNLYLLAFLLISPISETHHLAFMIPAVFLIALKLLFDERWFMLRNNLVFISFFVLFFLAKFNKYGPFYFFSIVILFGMTVWVLMSKKQSNFISSAACGSPRSSKCFASRKYMGP